MEMNKSCSTCLHVVVKVRTNYRRRDRVRGRRTNYQGHVSQCKMNLSVGSLFMDHSHWLRKDRSRLHIYRGSLSSLLVLARRQWSPKVNQWPIPTFAWGLWISDFNKCMIIQCSLNFKFWDVVSILNTLNYFFNTTTSSFQSVQMWWIYKKNYYTSVGVLLSFLPALCFNNLSNYIIVMFII